MVRCDWFSGYVAFCRKGRLAFVAVWKEREKTLHNNTADIPFYVKLNIVLYLVGIEKSDFCSNSFFLKMAFIAFWNQTLHIY